jgi:predicted GNAT family acetyltransferase
VINSVIHHNNRLKFEVETDSTDNVGSAYLTYEMPDDNNVIFTHTFVPLRQRGKGYAEMLVKTGIDWAKENNLVISSSCWYVDKYMAEHTE